MEIEQTKRMTDALEQYGLTPIQYAIMYFVDYDEGDLSNAQLSRRFSMTPQSMSEFVAILERKKLLKKTTDPSHKRIFRIALTAKGKKILETCNRELDTVERKFLKKLSAKEIETMRKLIGKVLEASRAMSSEQ
jgi:DNA-binding MarR family transcriptional regulator